MTLDQAYQRIDGMRYKLRGVAGILKVVRINGMTEIEHHPSVAGRRTTAYKKTRRELGDDYVTRVSECEETMGDIFARVWE